VKLVHICANPKVGPRDQPWIQRGAPNFLCFEQTAPPGRSSHRFPFSKFKPAGPQLREDGMRSPSVRVAANFFFRWAADRLATVLKGNDGAGESSEGGLASGARVKFVAQVWPNVLPSARSFKTVHQRGAPNFSVC